MPRFYFDTDDGERQFHDDEGIDLATADEVPKEAIGLLRDLAHHDMPVGCRMMVTKVRDITGALVYQATMTVVGQRFG